MANLTLDQLIADLIELRDRTKSEGLGVIVTVGGITGDRYAITQVSRHRRHVVLKADDVRAHSPAPTPEEIAESSKQIRDTWSRGEEHRRRGLTERVGINAGIRLCSTSFVREIDSSILTEL